MVSMLDSQSSSPEFEFILTTNWICFTVAASSNPRPKFVNSQLVCLWLVGILKVHVMLNLNYFFSYLLAPASVCAINTAKCK